MTFPALMEKDESRNVTLKDTTDLLTDLFEDIAMNTKQLCQALTANPVTNSYCDDVYLFHTLKDINKQLGLIICSIDPSNKPGHHWLLFFFKNNTVDFIFLWERTLIIMHLNL